MSRLCCPVCARRHATLVSPSCAVCAGTGTLALGPNVANVTSPAVGAIAVTLYLERAARRYSTEPYAEQPAHVEHAVAKLQEWGILSTTHDTPPVEPPLTLHPTPDVTAAPQRERQTARALADQWGDQTAAGDEQALQAPLLPHDHQRHIQDTHPGVFPPPHSRNGSRSHLARAVDQYPFNTTVTRNADSHEANERAAARLVAAFNQTGPS